jgi:hypothetical protein
MIFAIVMAFAVRSGLNSWTGAARGTGAWLHGFWTFVFGCLYVQWKVNRLLDSGEFSRIPAQSDAPLAPFAIAKENSP